jgi:uncharacterized repeat protein (TIGR04076 family)
MYKIKATVVKSLGDTRKYPCRYNYKIGDEIIFDGEGVKGRICPLALEAIVPKLGALRLAGPKYDPPEYYSPLYYAAPNVSDPAMAVYDGSGFRSTGAETCVEPPYHMRNLMPGELLNILACKKTARPRRPPEAWSNLRIIKTVDISVLKSHQYGVYLATLAVKLSHYVGGLQKRAPILTISSSQYNIQQWL